MNDEEHIKYFYEIVTSRHLLDEISDYVADCCTVRAGEQPMHAVILIKRTLGVFRLSWLGDFFLFLASIVELIEHIFHKNR